MTIGTRTRRGSVRQALGVTAAAAFTLVVVAVAPTTAGATWPGSNGRIAFDRSTDTTSQIWSMNGVTNGHGVQLTHLGSNDSPSYSPNGGVIAFDSDRTGVPQIWLMGAGGGDQRNISPDGNCSVYPSFSQNGRSIVFVHYPDTTCTGNPDL